MRKIIQLVAAADIESYRLFALCEDGTVWERGAIETKWSEMEGVIPDVPEEVIEAPKE